MAYHTEITGRVELTPPLSSHEISWLADFADTYHYLTPDRGPLVADRSMAQTGTFRDDQPKWLECPIVATDDGTALIVDPDNSKPYFIDEWLTCLLDHVFDAGNSNYIIEHLDDDPRVVHLNPHHRANGVLHCIGEEPDDVYDIIVTDSEVSLETNDEGADADETVTLQLTNHQHTQLLAAAAPVLSGTCNGPVEMHRMAHLIHTILTPETTETTE